ncbi:hypothetical protein D3C71_2008990 [compost metagenome]
MQARIDAQPMPQGDVDPVPAHVDHGRSRLDPHFDVRVTLVEPAQARYQPRCGESGDRAHGQGLAGLDLLQGLLDFLDLLESL